VVINLLVLFIIFAFILLFLSVMYKQEDPSNKWMVFISGLFLSLLGIYVMMYGIGNTNDWFTVALGVIFVGISFISIFSSMGSFILEEEE